MTTALRAFLQYARYRDLIRTDLRLSVPTVASWSMASLPRGLSSEDVQRLLNHCDRQTAIGCRNWAILLLLARLGLRAGEVVGLTLDDIDWERGELRIRANGRSVDLLPIPRDVGAALADYLHRLRPACACRQVFVRMRLSELTGIRRDTVILGAGAHIRVLGKGRKERAIPLTKRTVAVLKAWLRDIPDRGDAIVFPSARGAHLSSDGVQYILAKHVAVAAKSCLSLQQRRITPHMLRHTSAMELLQAGMDRSVIALWLGHESVETTQIYLDADLAMKEKALAKAAPPEGKPGRFRPDDRLMAFLKAL